MRKYEHEETKAMKEVIRPIAEEEEEVALRDLRNKFMTDYKPRERGMMVCSFLAHEIAAVHEYVKTSHNPNDQKLLNALILVYGWIADVTENEDLRDMISDNKRTFTVTLSEDEFISLANLSVTLHENLDGMKTIKDFESDDMTVAEAVERGLPGYEAVMKQLEW